MIRHLEQLSVRKSFSIWPIVITWLAENPWNFFKLVHLRTSRKQWLECIQLCHNATKSKYVYRVVITSAAKYIFRGSVPSSWHILCKWSGISNFFNKSKVSNFNDWFALYKYVFWFDISVEEAVIVDVVKTCCNLLNNVSNLFMAERVVI